MCRVHNSLAQVCHLGRLLEESTGELQAAVTDLRLAQGRCQRLEAKMEIKVEYCCSSSPNSTFKWFNRVTAKI